MKHYFSTKVRVALVVAVLLAVALVLISNLSGLSIPEMLTKGILTPIRNGATALTKQAEQFYSYMFEYEALAAQNEELLDRIAKMEDDARRADALARENDRLRSMLELKAAHEDYELVDAYIISWDDSDWNDIITVNRGASSGIQVDMCAITANGEVVGLVTEVGPNYSVIRTVLDSALEISATISASGYNGMVTGSYITGQDDMLRMDYLPSSAKIRINDKVVTAGSTVYPRDLILGYVVDAGFDDTGVAKFALLEPATNFDDLEQVFILTDYNIETSGAVETPDEVPETTAANAG